MCDNRTQTDLGKGSPSAITYGRPDNDASKFALFQTTNTLQRSQSLPSTLNTLLSDPTSSKNVKICTPPIGAHTNNMPVRSTLDPGYQGPTMGTSNHSIATNGSSDEAKFSAGDFKGKIDNLEELEKVQDELQDTRDVALGARYDLQLQRTRLRDIRQQAGSAEAAFMEQLRKYFLDHELAMPSNIVESYDRMKEVREHLGVADEEYLEAEEDYNALEWSMAQKEVKFLEKLADPRPSDTVSCRSVEAANQSMGLEDLTRYAEGQDETSSSLPMMTPNDTQQKDIKHEYHSSDVCVESRTHITRPSSVQPLQSGGTEPPAFVRPIAYSESARYDLSWTDTRDRIDVWIFRSVLESRLEKTRLKQYVDPVALKDLGDQEWWKLVIKHWTASNHKIVKKPVVEESSTRFGIAGTEGPIGAHSIGGLRPDLFMSTVDARSVVPEASLPSDASPLDKGMKGSFASAKPETPESQRTESYIHPTWNTHDYHRSDIPVRADAPLGQDHEMDPDRVVPMEADNQSTANSRDETNDDMGQDPTHAANQNRNEELRSNRSNPINQKDLTSLALPTQDVGPKRSFGGRDMERDRTSIPAFHIRTRSDSPQSHFEDGPTLRTGVFTTDTRTRAVTPLSLSRTLSFSHRMPCRTSQPDPHSASNHTRSHSEELRL